VKKYRNIPDTPGLYWSLKQNKATPEPVLVYFRQVSDGSSAQVVTSFNGGYRRYIEDGEYFLGPVEPPVVEGDFTAREAPTLLAG
jgi:hypothetical protein